MTRSQQAFQKSMHKYVLIFVFLTLCNVGLFLYDYYHDETVKFLDATRQGLYWCLPAQPTATVGQPIIPSKMGKEGVTIKNDCEPFHGQPTWNPLGSCEADGWQRERDIL